MPALTWLTASFNCPAPVLIAERPFATVDSVSDERIWLTVETYVFKPALNCSEPAASTAVPFVFSSPVLSTRSFVFFVYSFVPFASVFVPSTYVITPFRSWSAPSVYELIHIRSFSVPLSNFPSLLSSVSTASE